MLLHVHSWDPKEVKKLMEIMQQKLKGVYPLPFCRLTVVNNCTHLNVSYLLPLDQMIIYLCRKKTSNYNVFNLVTWMCCKFFLWLFLIIKTPALFFKYFKYSYYVYTVFPPDINPPKYAHVNPDFLSFCYISFDHTSVLLLHVLKVSK